MTCFILLVLSRVLDHDAQVIEKASLLVLPLTAGGQPALTRVCLQAEADEIEIEGEKEVLKLQLLQKAVAELQAQMRIHTTAPAHALPFLQVGRLVRVLNHPDAQPGEPSVPVHVHTRASVTVVQQCSCWVCPKEETPADAALGASDPLLWSKPCCCNSLERWVLPQSPSASPSISVSAK